MVLAAIKCRCVFVVSVYLIFPFEIQGICLHVRFAGVGTDMAASVQLSHLEYNHTTIYRFSK